MRKISRVILNTIKHESDSHKELTSLSIENLQTLDLWVLFLIYYSNFSFLLKIRLKFTLR